MSEKSYKNLSLTCSGLQGGSKIMRARYVNVSIHEELAKKIDEYIKRSKNGYRSRAEVVSDALRRLFDKKL